MMRWTPIDGFDLMHDTVIAMRDTATAVTKCRAKASPLGRREQRLTQRCFRQAKCAVQSIDIDDTELRYDALIGVDVRSHQMRKHPARQRICLLEFP
ncbi:hypothetical protein UB46_18710 [Burkholderiaceae bacterium 16]|nr:hypothetical protein UB46_18710 [Burkholderiaceae bacterium 16]